MKTTSLKTNAILNTIKQCCTILFPFITFPYISRTLGETGFGKYSFSFSIVTYFAYIAALGISTYAIREGAKVRNDRNKLNRFCSELFTISLLATGISYILLIIYLIFNTKAHSYTIYIVILSLAMLIDALGADWVNSIFEDFTYITIRYIIFQVISLGLLFLFVHNENDVTKYCIITLLATHGGNLVNLLYVRKRIHLSLTCKPNIRVHIFPLLILFFNSLAIVIYVNADITMLGYYFSDDVVGIYSFSSRIYNILKNIINAVVVVSLPRVAYLLSNEKDHVKNYLSKIFSGLTYIMLPAVCGLFCLSRRIIVLVGGTGYLSGDTSLKILSIAILFAIYASFFTNCVLIVNKQEKKCLISTITSAAINILLNLILLPKYRITAAALTTMIAEIMNFVIQTIFAKKEVSFRFIEIKNQISCLVGCIAVVAVCTASNKVCESNIGLLITIFISVIVYGIITIVLRNYIALIGFRTILSRVKR